MKHLYFRVKDSVDKENHPLLDIFFKEWIGSSCDYNVNIIKNKVRDVNRYFDIYYYKVSFTTGEDALAIKLKGIPPEFKNHLEIVE